MRTFQCTVCSTFKPEVEFRKPPSDGETSECRECEKTFLRCTGCKVLKSVEEFTKAKTTTGYVSQCKTCRLAASRTEEAKRKRKEYYSRPDIKAKAKARNRERYESVRNNPVSWAKHRARLAVGQALKNGRLVRPPTCEANGKYGDKCLGGPLTAHHHKGYAQEHWLDVEWLCTECHNVADIRARDEGTDVAPDTVDWQAVLAIYGNACAYCGEVFGPDCVATMDHVLPIDCGGRHCTENVVPSCFDCNRKKRSRPIRRPEPGRPETVESLLEELEGPEPLYTCTVCGDEKTRAGFRHGRRGGLRTECLECEQTVLRCPRCDTVKSKDAFAPDPYMDTGRKSHCRQCCQAYQSVARKTEEYRANRKAYRDQDHIKAKTAAYNKAYWAKKQAGKTTQDLIPPAESS